MSEQPGRYQRSFGGMVMAMAVVVALVIGYVAIRGLLRTDPANPVPPVDYRQPAAYARQQARFDVAVPRRLPPGWVATSVRFTDGEQQAWHLGTLTDERRYVGLEQAERPSADMVEQYVDPQATRGADRTIDGRRWQTWTDDGGDNALVREQKGVTTLLVGMVSQRTLETFLATLR